MAKDNLTRADIAEAVRRELGWSRADSAMIVNQTIDEVSKCLTNSGTVKLSSFGTLATKTKRARVGRNPKNGDEFAIKPRRVVSFRASTILKKRINDSVS